MEEALKASRVEKKTTKIQATTAIQLQNDIITNSAGQRVQATGSQGLTLNMNIAGAVRVSDHFEINYVLAAPAVVRKARPDGLTRSFVFIVGFKYTL